MINKLKAALYVFTKSLSSPAYYRDIIKTKFSFSMKYYLVLALVASLITFPTLIEPTMNDLRNTVATIDETIVDTYPEDLVVTIKDGELSINKEEPYFFTMPEVEKEVVSGEKTYTNLLVIDTQGTLDDLDRYDTVILVNKTNLLARSSNRVEVYPLEEYPDTEINKQAIENLLKEARPFIDAIPYIVLGMALIGTIFYYFGIRLVYLVVVAGILGLFGLIVGLKLKYSKYYQIGIHAITLPLLIEVFSGVFEFPINIPFWFLMLNILIGILGIVSIKKNKVDTNI